MTNIQNITPPQLDWNKTDGLIPCVIQNVQTLEVLMLGYMNPEALEKTIKEGRVTFYSRSKQKLWTKGETSGNFLILKSVHYDCDQDALLMYVEPIGSTCHLGNRSCFDTNFNQNFLFKLEEIIGDRYKNPTEGSYVNSLKNNGLNKIVQKLGEESIETVIAALTESEMNFINEASDLVFHLSVLLVEKKLSWKDIALNLEKRNK